MKTRKVAARNAASGAIFVRRRAPGSPPLSKRLLTQAARRMLKALDLEDSELSILLCDSGTMRQLNREHRGIDKDTDVLSFPQSEFRAPLRPMAGGDLSLLGDVIICVDKALHQASGRRRSLEDEAVFLLAHGLLHLVGYDHDEPERKNEMTRATRRLVQAAAETKSR